jgi:hypothetical protein
VAITNGQNKAGAEETRPGRGAWQALRSPRSPYGDPRPPPAPSTPRTRRSCVSTYSQQRGRGPPIDRPDRDPEELRDMRTTCVIPLCAGAAARHMIRDGIKGSLFLTRPPAASAPIMTMRCTAGRSGVTMPALPSRWIGALLHRASASAPRTRFRLRNPNTSPRTRRDAFLWAAWGCPRTAGAHRVPCLRAGELYHGRTIPGRAGLWAAEGYADAIGSIPPGQKARRTDMKENAHE